VRAQLGEIDLSTRAPLLVFLVSGVVWLLLASALGLISAIQLHNPGFLGESAWSTFGRIRPAFLNAFVYGWAFNGAFAVTLWLMARLTGSAIRGVGLAVVGGLFWNAAVAVGVVGILAGHTTGFEFLEMPGYVAPILFAAYAAIGAVILANFRLARGPSLYVSQWYLLGALFWFPWFYTAAQMMLVYSPVRGTVQSIVATWYVGNLIGLWFVPVGLAAIYYLLPKLLGRPVAHYAVARLGFWSLVIFWTWAGARQLVGSPVPVWVQAAGSAACLVLVVPIFALSLNFFGSLSGQWRKVGASPTLRFTAFAAISFLVAGVGEMALALRSVAQYAQFTYVTQALVQIELYAFFSMAVFGAAYFILPRILRREWPSAALITAHFWSSAAGITLAVVCLVVGGWLQGLATLDVEAYPSYVDVVARTIPFLFGHSLALVLLAVGHVAFAGNLALMLIAAPAAQTSELFRRPPALEVVQ
jgi:cytochrome c oxidase cbb3-type subunit I